MANLLSTCRFLYDPKNIPYRHRRYVRYCINGATPTARFRS